MEFYVENSLAAASAAVTALEGAKTFRRAAGGLECESAALRLVNSSTVAAKEAIVEAEREALGQMRAADGAAAEAREAVRAAEAALAAAKAALEAAEAETKQAEDALSLLGAMRAGCGFGN